MSFSSPHVHTPKLFRLVNFIGYIIITDLFIFQFLRFALPQFLANALSYQVSCAQFQIRVLTTPS